MTPASAPFEATLDIEQIVAGGDGLARHEALVVFLPRTLAGERVRARVTVKGRLARGHVLSVERPSPVRVAPECAHYEADGCGGCQLQHAAYEEQLRAKGAIVATAFKRIAHLEIATPEVHPAASPWRYRRKLTLALRKDGPRWYAGLRRHDAPNAVFALRDCRITAEPVVQLWHDVLAAGGHLPAAESLRGSVRVGQDGGASFVLEGADVWPAAAAFFSAVPALRSLWWIPAHGKRRRMATREPASGAQEPGASFTQVNAATGEAMLAYVLARVRAHGPAHVVDAYAGVGDASAALDAEGVRVTAIELDRDAGEWVAHRLSARCDVVMDRVESALADVLPADVVILNPPRTGVDARVCEVLSAANPAPAAVVYVSCDPATLARDVSRMPGWRIASLTCFDMFPQTAHVETVCELVRDVPVAPEAGCEYIVDVQGERVEVSLDEKGVRVGGLEIAAHLADVEGTPAQVVTIGSTVHRVVMHRTGAKGAYVLWIDGWRFAVEALDERTRAIRDMSAASAASTGPAPLVAPMPGLVVRILANEGAEVVAGQPLVVMEAMKMENELRAPSSGRVATVRVRPGDAVEKGAVLVELA